MVWSNFFMAVQTIWAHYILVSQRKKILFSFKSVLMHVSGNVLAHPHACVERSTEVMTGIKPGQGIFLSGSCKTLKLALYSGQTEASMSDKNLICAHKY